MERDLYPQLEDAYEDPLKIEEIYEESFKNTISKFGNELNNFVFENREFLEQEENEKKFLKTLIGGY